MPHQGAGFAKAEFHSRAAQGDTNLETALNYEAALIECASGSRSAVGKIYAREKDQLRAVATSTGDIKARAASCHPNDPKSPS